MYGCLNCVYKFSLWCMWYSDLRVWFSPRFVRCSQCVVWAAQLFQLISQLEWCSHMCVGFALLCVLCFAWVSRFCVWVSRLVEWCSPCCVWFSLLVSWCSQFAYVVPTYAMVFFVNGVYQFSMVFSTLCMVFLSDLFVWFPYRILCMDFLWDFMYGFPN